MRWLACLLLLGLVGCAARIPEKVSAEEYEVYSAWLRQHFEKESPKVLYLANRTIALSPYCPDTRRMRDHSLVFRLAALGEATYALGLLGIKIPSAFTGADAFPRSETRTFRFIQFSRVAFSYAHTRALFAVSDCCPGPGQGGLVMIAHREKGGWIFEPAGCNWFY